MKEKNKEICEFPKEWSNWQIKELISEGSCGKVYRVEDEAETVSAVKVMSVPKDSFEIQALNRLAGCPYVVKVEDSIVWEEQDRCRVFLRMEYLKSLEELLHERALDEEEAIEMMMELCRGLERCEQEGILHRDIKPENILLTKDHHAKLGDFGIAGNIAENDQIPTIQGSFSYMPPEMFHGQGYEKTSDLYSLGLVFYRVMNRGREPFVPLDKHLVSYQDREIALERRMDGEILPAPVDASPEFARILQKACAFCREKRYQNAASLRRDLKKCQRGKKYKLVQRIRRLNRTGRAAAAAMLLLMFAGIGCGVWYQTPILEQTNDEYGFSCQLKRNGTMILEGSGTLNMVFAAEEWLTASTKIQKLIIRGDVTRIEQQFSVCPSLKEVLLPEGLESLGPFVFSDCANLKKINLPDSLKEIGHGTFANCRSLTSVKLPRQLEKIESNAFWACRNLRTITFPQSVNEIGANAFDETAWMAEQSTKGDFLVINGILLDYFGEKEEVTIPESMEIRCVEANAFSENKNLKKIVFPDTVEKLGEGAFSNCSALTEVVLPKGIKELSEYLFVGCTSLEYLTIPESVERIGRSALKDCSSMKKILLPNSVTSIGEEAFLGTAWYEEQAAKEEFILLNHFLIAWNGDKEELVIPDDLGITRIADYAIAWKGKLSRVVIPEGVISIGECCFFFSRNLEQIEFPESVQEFGRGAMATTKWMEERQDEEDPQKPVLVNGIDVSY